MVTGRSTTIREEWQAGKVIPMKHGEQRVGQPHKVLRYLVVMDGETFDVSGADYETVSPPQSMDRPWTRHSPRALGDIGSDRRERQLDRTCLGGNIGSRQRLCPHPSR